MGLVVFYVGGTLAFGFSWGAILFVPVVLALQFGVIRPEEAHLGAICGEPYRLYQQRVRRWL
jgi:protein-S-isoprenylcysteine O-methyltransferase Ste14